MAYYNGEKVGALRVWHRDSVSKETMHAVLPDVRNIGASVTVNGKIYVLGGWNAYGMTDTIFEYDVETDMCVECQSRLRGMDCGIPATSVNGIVYYFHSFTESPGVDIFDPTNDTVEFVQLDMLFPEAGCVAIDTRIYIFTPNDYVRVFETTTRQISTLSSKVSTYRRPKCFYTGNGIIYLVDHAQILRYDVSNDTYLSTIALQRSQEDGICFLLDDMLYVSAGRYDSWLDGYSMENSLTRTFSCDDAFYYSLYETQQGIVNDQLYVLGGLYVPKYMASRQKLDTIVKTHISPKHTDSIIPKYGIQ